MKVYITDMGIFSSIGLNLEENYRSLKHSIDGLTTVTLPEMQRKKFIGGEIKLRNEELKSEFSLSDQRYIHRSTLIGLKAAKEAWKNRFPVKNIRTGFIYGTTIGSVDLDGELMYKLAGKNPDAKVDFTLIHDETFGTNFIARQLGGVDSKTTVSTACSTSANAIMLGARLIQSGKLDRVIAGGAESLTNYTMNGFDSLGLYSENKCKPFDANRQGLNLGEGGAFIVLENEKSIQLSGSNPFALLSGWGNACDAFHSTAMSPNGRGAELAMRKALAVSGLMPQEISGINMHGTGTVNNDLSELTAVHTVFEKNIPLFTGTKSFTGHTLAAAGGVEAVFSLLSITNKEHFPTLSHNESMHEFGNNPVKSCMPDARIKHYMSNSFGFGGNCSSLIFSAV